MIGGLIMKLPSILTWEWFCQQARKRWPASPAPPQEGCWKEAVVWLRKNRHFSEARRLLLTATGERSWALSLAASYGLIEERGAALRALIQKAPGDRTLALSLAASSGLIEERGAALRALIQKAPGNRTLALYWAARDGLIDDCDIQAPRV